MADDVTAEQLTVALEQAGKGDRRALDALIPAVYDELRRLAQHAMGREYAGHTLQATAVANEAYIRLLGQRKLDVNNRSQFYALAATLIRRILVDHARARDAEKRGGAYERVTLSGVDLAGGGGADPIDLLALEEALTGLAAMDPALARLVELRFFGGLTVDETAASMGISPRKAADDWAFARAWLARQLGDKGKAAT